MKIYNHASHNPVRNIIISIIAFIIFIAFFAFIMQLELLWLLILGGISAFVVSAFVIKEIVQPRNFLEKKIDYTDFQEGYVTFNYGEKDTDISIPYSDIDVMDLTFYIGIINTKCGKKPYLSGVDIKIFSNETEYSIYNSFFNIFQLYKIISLTRLEEKLHYNFKGCGLNIQSGRNLRSKIIKNINDTIQNNYKIKYWPILEYYIEPAILILLLITLLCFCMFTCNTDSNQSLLNNSQPKQTSQIYNKYYNRTYTYYKNKQYEKAIQEAQQGIKYLNDKQKNTEDTASIYYTMGSSYYKLKQYDLAKNAYDNAIKYSEKNKLYVYKARGKCYYHMNQKDLALQDFYKQKKIIAEYMAKGRQNRDNDERWKEKINKLNKWIYKCQN